MITFHNGAQLKRTAYDWQLNIPQESKDKDGNPKIKYKASWHPSVLAAAQHLLNLELDIDGEVQDLIDSIEQVSLRLQKDCRHLTPEVFRKVAQQEDEAKEASNDGDDSTASAA